MAVLNEVADIMERMQLNEEQAKIAYLKWRIIYLGGMTGLRYPVDYKCKWVTQLEKECNNYSLSFKERLTINAIHIPFFRIFLIMEKCLKHEARKLINKINKDIQ